MTFIPKNSQPVTKGITSYPAPFDEKTDLYEAMSLGEAAGLSQFGVGIETLLPEGLSSQRHWHENEDEFLYLLSGEAVLIEDNNEFVMRAGDAAGWKAGVANGHHLVNRSDRPATFLIVGTRAKDDTVHYSDVDLKSIRKDGKQSFTRKDGSSFSPHLGEEAK